MRRIDIRALLLMVGALFLSMIADAAQPLRASDPAAVRTEVQQAIEQWKQAVIKADRAGLERSYHADLSYGHTDGAVLTKQQQIDRTVEPGRSFPAIDISDLAIRPYGNVALVTAVFTFHSLKDGKESVSRLSGLDVWIRSESGWQLLGRQLTRPSAGASADSDLLKRAEAIHKAIITFDNHVDLPFEYGSGALDAANDGTTQFDLPKLSRGIVKGAALAVFVPQGPRTPEATQDASRKAEQKYQIITSIAAKYPDQAEIAYSSADLKRIEAAGKFAIVLSILNGYPIGDDLGQIDVWYKKGVRQFGFAHAGNNELADSARPNLLRGDKLGEHGGLSKLGRKAVGRLNDLGVVIDVSQLSAQAFAQVLSLTRAPVVASHSNARAIINHPRNLDDQQLLAIKANGGVVAVNAYSSWVRPLPVEAQRKANEIRSKYGVPVEDNIAAVQPLTGAGVKVLTQEQFEAYSKEFHAVTGDPAYRATVAQYVDQIDYVVKKIGIDHVGISSDFNHGGGVVGFNDEGEALNVTAELLRRGYTEQDIAKLWGGNFIRVWERVQSLARH